MKCTEQRILDVLKSNDSKTIKTKKIIELGLPANLIDELFSLYYDAEDIPFTIGVEIECFNVDKPALFATCREHDIELREESHRHTTVPHFKLTRDSSINGNDAVECVTPILKNMSGIDRLERVCNALQGSGARINESCGLHVHIGLQDMTFENYRNIFVNYWRLESAIDALMPPPRRGNASFFCKSLRRVGVEKIAICKGFNEISNVLDNNRCFKVNPESYSRHNTVEFRQHHGTIDFKTIHEWVMFLVLLAKYSKNHVLTDSISDIDAIPFLNKKEKKYFNKRAAAFA
jgi:hypothetical protein